MNSTQFSISKVGLAHTMTNGLMLTLAVAASSAALFLFAWVYVSILIGLDAGRKATTGRGRTYWDHAMSKVNWIQRFAYKLVRDGADEYEVKSSSKKDEARLREEARIAKIRKKYSFVEQQKRKGLWSRLAR